MNDRLTEVSESAATLIREGLQDSRDAVLKAQKLVDGLRSVPVVVNGTKESLKTLSVKLDECDQMYTKIFQHIARTYGDPVGESGPAPAEPTEDPNAADLMLRRTEEE